MHPRKFKQLIGKGMTTQRLAELLGRTKGVVDHWVQDPTTSSYKEPPRDVKDHLSSVYLLFVILKALRRDVSKKTLRILDHVLDEQEDQHESE